MTFGAKIPLCCNSANLESLLPDAPLAFIKVPQLTPGNDFLKIGSGRFGAAQRYGQLGTQGLLQLLGFAEIHRNDHSIRTEIGDSAPHITNRCIHRIRECFPDIATHDQSPFLRHEACHIAAVARDNYRAALHRDAEPRSGVTKNHNRPASDACSGAAPCTPMHTYGATQHRLRNPPTSTACDFNRCSVDQAAAIVTGAAREANVRVSQNSDGKIVPCSWVFHSNLLTGFGNQSPDSAVDLSCCPSGCVHLCHTRTSLACASCTANSPGIAPRIAISSVATATKRSVSANTSGLNENVSFTNPRAESVATRQLKDPSNSAIMDSIATRRFSPCRNLFDRKTATISESFSV